MKDILKKVGTFFGYSLYFVAALAIFVYLTLPIEEAKAYLVRLASDTYNADLEITELSLTGISGVQAEGVVVTVRPSPEELAKIREAQALRQAWDAQQAELRANEELEKKAAESADKKPKKPKKPKKTDSAAETDTKPTSKGADPKSKKPKKKVTEKAPEVPSGPLPVSIDRLAVSIGLSDFVADLLDGQLFNEDAQVRVETSLLGGSLQAQISRNNEGFEFKANAEELSLTQMNTLARLAPVPIIGQLSLDIALTLPLDDKGRHQLTKLGGHMKMDIANAVIGPGQVSSEKLKSLGGTIEVPKLTLARFGGQLNFAKRRATFEKFKFSGKDVDGDISGYIQLAKTFARFGPRSYLRFKFSDAFLKKNSAVKTILKNVPMVKRGTAADGFTGFTVTGRLSKPSWRPRKTNPYGVRKKGRRGKADKKFKSKSSGAKSRIKKSRSRFSSKKSKKGPTSAKSLSKVKPRKPPVPAYGNSNPPGYPSKPSSAYSPSKRKVKVPDEPEEEDEDEEEEDEEEEPESDEDEDAKSEDSTDSADNRDSDKKGSSDDDEDD